MRIRLRKTELLSVFACFRQAERSLDAALRTDWSAFRAWYEEFGRREFLERQIDFLGTSINGSVASTAVDANDSPRLEDQCSDVWLVFVRGTLNRFRRSWRFTSREIGVWLSTLRRVRELLNQATRPSDETLVQLRMHDAACRLSIESRLYGVYSLRHAGRIEHFMQPEWQTHISTEQLIGRSFTRRASTLRATADAK